MRGREKWKVSADRYEVSFWGDEYILDHVLKDSPVHTVIMGKHVYNYVYSNKLSCVVTRQSRIRSPDSAPFWPWKGTGTVRISNKECEWLLIKRALTFI